MRSSLFLVPVLSLLILSDALAADDADEPADPPVPAGTKEDPVPMSFEELTLTRDRSPSYPMKPSGPSACIATLLVDENGRITIEDVAADEGSKCQKPIRAAIEEAVARWGFESPMRDGDKVYARVPVPFTFDGASGALLKSESDEVLGKLFRSYEAESGEGSGACTLSMEVFADGDVTNRRTDDRYNCLALPAGKPPKKLYKKLKGDAETCMVSLDAVEREATNITSECGDLDAFVPDLLKSWSFNGTKDGRPYRLALRFSTSRDE